MQGFQYKRFSCLSFWTFETIKLILLNIDNNKKYFWATNQHIQMISEGSRGTEDWSNGCWKVSFAITGIN